MKRAKGQMESCIFYGVGESADSALAINWSTILDRRKVRQSYKRVFGGL